MSHSQSQTNLSAHIDSSQQTSATEIRAKPFDSRTQAHLKVLIKLTRQKEKATHHIEVLAEATQLNRPPRGLVPRINARLPDTSATFTLDWEEILHQTGLKLTHKLLEFWTLRQIKIQEELKRIETSLKTIADTAQCKEIQTILDDIARTTIMDLKRRKPQTQRNNLALQPVRKTSQVQFRGPGQNRQQQTGEPTPGGSRDQQS
jgi:hypothetical protein